MLEQKSSAHILYYLCWNRIMGGKIRNNLGVNNENNDFKPRKSEKNILPEYELENQIPTETTWD